jgi:hypothetical protein
MSRARDIRHLGADRLLSCLWQQRCHGVVKLTAAETLQLASGLVCMASESST